MKIALAQTNPIWMDKKGNMTRCTAQIKTAADHGAQMIIFPEMTLTGFSSAWEKTAEPWQDSPTQAAFAAAARAYGLTVVYGSVILRDGRPENHAIAIGPQGEVLADYSKIHPFLGWEDHDFRKGDRLAFFQAGGLDCSLFICYDLRFPEIFSAAAAKSHLMIVIASWPDSRQSHWRILAQARAIENQCFVAAVNRTGTGDGLTFQGGCMLLDPLGNLLTDGTGAEQGMFYGEADKKQVEELRRAFPKADTRRPEIYRRLLDGDGS